MVSPDDLVDNALLFGQEAVEHYLVREDGKGYDWRFVSLFAATSMEQLLKAFLVATNPLLIANNRDSLLALAGAKVRDQAALRTITPTEAFNRSRAFLPRLTSLEGRVSQLFAIRNGVVHLVEEEPADFPEVFDAYLKAMQHVLRGIDLNDQDFWDELDPVVRKRLGEREATLEREVEAKIRIAGLGYETRHRGLTREEGRILQEGTFDAIPPWTLTPNDSLDVRVSCPACDSAAVVSAWVDVDWEMNDFDWRPITMLTAHLLRCAACELELEDDEVEMAGIELDPPDGFDPSSISDPPEWRDPPGWSDEEWHPRPPPH